VEKEGCRECDSQRGRTKKTGAMVPSTPDKQPCVMLGAWTHTRRQSEGLNKCGVDVFCVVQSVVGVCCVVCV